jgi:5-formyltetrahydrofolate cyclo-ligase
MRNLKNLQNTGRGRKSTLQSPAHEMLFRSGTMMKAQKDSLRKKMRAPARPRSSALSAGLAERLRGWTSWQQSSCVCVFSALAGEPDVLASWPEGKRIALPRVQGEQLQFHWVASPAELEAGSFGILEPAAGAPAAGNAFDLLLVPGLAFDRQGGRLGRGKGFYDRFLAGARGIRVGVCFEDQIVGEVPMDPHDLRMDFVVTPSAIFRCGS